MTVCKYSYEDPINPLQETTPAGAKPKKLQRPEGGKMPASRQIYSLASWFSAAMMARRRRWWCVEPEGGRWGSCRGGIGESWWCCSGRRQREQRQRQGGRRSCCHLPCPAGNTPLRPPVKISRWCTLHGATEVHSAYMLTDKVGLIKNKMNSSLILILCDDGSLFLFFYFVCWSKWAAARSAFQLSWNLFQSSVSISSVGQKTSSSTFRPIESENDIVRLTLKLAESWKVREFINLKKLSPVDW